MVIRKEILERETKIEEEGKGILVGRIKIKKGKMENSRDIRRREFGNGFGLYKEVGGREGGGSKDTGRGRF